MKTKYGYDRSYKKLIAAHILFTVILLSVIFVTRIGFSGGFNGFYAIFMNCVFIILYIAILNEFYKNYKFVIDNNYKIYTKASRNLVIAMIIISLVLLFIVEIFGNILWKKFFMY